MKIRDLEAYFQTIYPAQRACAWDNDGLLICPDREQEVTRVLTCLDVTFSAIEKAMAERFPEIKITSSTWNDLEFNNPSAHKGSSLARFAEYLGFGLENCMSFGDGRNDLTMIEAAGIGVAMENAVEEVKAAADYITKSNDEDGVAEAIRKFV
jgi:Cof subfamily protein (haloacid dehalogenase superfamily)